MANLCVPKEVVDAIVSKITSGKISPEVLASMTSDQRLKYFNKIVGAERGKKAYDILQKEFDKELKKLALSETEIKEAFNLNKATIELRKEFNDANGEWKSPQAKADYGATRVIYENYLESLKTEHLTVREMLTKRMGQFKEESKTNMPHATASLLLDAVKTISENSIAAVASFDNSFMGRQGLKTLIVKPKIWWDMANKSFGDFYETLKGENVKDALWADIYSDPYFLDGSYKKSKIIAKWEEQYPVSIMERIPVLGRFFKASEQAFIGSALRARTSLYKNWAEQFKKNGVDITNQYQIESLGKLVNSLTARGQWGKKGESTLARLILWAPKMLKGNIDVLTGHLGQDISPMARKQAATNLLRIVGVTAGVMMVANAMKPGSAETDPRSADFGKIRIGNTRFDITGGAASIVTLASRLVSNSTKSSTTGEVKKYGAEYGQADRLDVLVDFLTGKSAPPTRVLVDILKGQTFEGKKPTVGNETFKMWTPISIQNALDLKDDNSAQAVLAVILDGIGINANTYSVTSDWSINESKATDDFKTKYGEKIFNEANDKYNQAFNDWFVKVKTNSVYQGLSSEQKANVISNKKTEIKDDVLRQYGYRYRQQKSKPLPKF